MKKIIIIILLNCWVLSLFAQWQSVAGQARDIGVGANGTVWVIGWTPVSTSYNISRWNGSYWEDIPGAAVRIDVDPNGNAWVVNDAGHIFRWNGQDWVNIGGQAHDVGIGADGTVWVIGWTSVPGGYNIARWNGSYWEDIPGGAVRIDVDPNGNAWIVNDAGLIFRWNGQTWEGIGGQGHDVGIGADGTVWLIGWTAIPGGYGIARWTGSYWEEISGGLNNISGGPNGSAWGANSDGIIWQWPSNRISLSNIWSNVTVMPLFATIPAGTYTINNKNSNLCLAIRGATMNNGEEATLWTCDGNADKNWKIIDAGNGEYKIQNANSNLFLAIGGGSRDNGGRAIQYADEGQADILWRFIDVGSGYYKIQNKNSGLFLAVGAGSRERAADLVQWADEGQEDIKWRLDYPVITYIDLRNIPVSLDPSATIQTGSYTIANKNSNLCLGIRGETRIKGKEGTQLTCNGSANQEWKIIDGGGGYYKIQNVNSLLFLALGEGSRDNGGRVVQDEDEGQPSILWRFIDLGAGYYRIQNKHSGLFLAIGAGSREAGADLVQWTDGGQEDIKWKMESIPYSLSGVLGNLGNINALTFATLYPNANFDGEGVRVIEAGRKTLSEWGLTSMGSIKVTSGYKVIIRYKAHPSYYDPVTNEIRTGETTMEVLEDMAGGLPNEIINIEIMDVPTPATVYLTNGYVDMHTHPMSHLGFGRKALHGAPDIGCIIPAGTYRCNPTSFRATSIDQALGSCNSTHGGWGTDNGCGDYLRAAIINYALDSDFEHKVGFERNPHGDHEQAGYPDLRFWPNHTSILHQQMWVDWIRRAYQGGLRVMVALTVNSELLGEILNGDPPYDDKTVADVQIDETIRFVNAHPDFMEIAYSKADLQRIIRSNRLAVVLGMEIDKIGNFGKPGVVTTEASVRAEIQRLHNKGIRYIFPIHLIDNAFGGSAVYNPLLNFANKRANGYFFRVMTSPDPNVTYRANLTDGPIGLENEVILGLRGHLEAVGGLPAPCFNDLLKCQPFPPGIVRCCGSYERILNILSPDPTFDAYKFIPGGHANSLGLLSLGESAINEMMKLGMIIDIDHMSELAMTQTIEIAEAYANHSGYPLNMGHNGVRGANGKERGAPLALIERISALGGMVGVGTAEATPESFATEFRKVWNAMGGRGVAIGSDVNGFEPLPKRSEGKNPAFSNNFYLDFFRDQSISTKCTTGNRTWDYVEDGGVSHYGLMPEFLYDVTWHHAGDVITNLSKSATYFEQMWEKCERLSTSTAMGITEITLAGISSNIHNGDCKRLYGKVNLSVWETDEAGNRTTQIDPVSGGGEIINWEAGPVRNVANFPGDEEMFPNVENISSVYAVDPIFLRQGRVVVVVSTKLASAHKGCDTCLDHTWDSTMLSTSEQVFSLRDLLEQPNAVKPFVAGPYRTGDNRHDFRVHFEVR